MLISIDEFELCINGMFFLKWLLKWVNFVFVVIVLLVDFDFLIGEYGLFVGIVF